MPDETDAAPTQAAPADAVECAAELLRDESQGRLWLRALVPILQLKAGDSEPAGIGRGAFELMYAAACDRACRILRSDLDR